MANNNIEIEIKVKLDEESFNRFEAYFSKNADFIKNSYQVDEYFVPAHRNFIDHPRPYEWLRIGERSGKTIINYKHWYPEEGEAHLYCDEYETIAENKEQIEKIFSALNFKSIAIVKKDRNTYNYKDQFEIALDKVDNLGCYIEIEVIKDFGSIEEGVKRLHEFAEKIGIDLSKRETRGYPMILIDEAKNN